MGRDRTKLQRALDLKPRAHRFFTRLTADNPALRRRLGFFPEYVTPDAARITILHDSIHEFPLRDARYRAALDIILQNNVEEPESDCIRREEWSSQRVVALIDDVLVYGKKVDRPKK